MMRRIVQWIWAALQDDDGAARLSPASVAELSAIWLLLADSVEKVAPLKLSEN